METWFTDLTPESALHLSGVQLHRVDRDTAQSSKTKGDGIYFYVKEHWCKYVTAVMVVWHGTGIKKAMIHFVALRQQRGLLTTIKKTKDHGAL